MMTALSDPRIWYSDWRYVTKAESDPREVRVQQYISEETVEFFDDLEHLENRVIRRLCDQLRDTAESLGLSLFHDSIRLLQPSYEPARKRWVMVAVGWGCPR